MSASSRQRISDADFPACGTPREKMAYALKYAMLAPTEIDWQPWEFEVTDAHIELMARNEPSHQDIDPEGRELMISCGSALMYLKLALRHFGCLGRVELFPALDHPRLAARIHFGCLGERDALDRRLFEAVTRRADDVSLEERAPLPEGTLAALSHAVGQDRGWIEFAHSDTSRQRLMEFLPISSPQPQSATPLSESRSTSGASPLFRFLIRRPEPVTVAEVGELPVSLPSATLAVVKTKTDDKHGWLAAGHAMARIILHAQALGLAWGFFNQPVRRRYAREALRTHIGHKGFAQVILQLTALAKSNPYGRETVSVSPAAFQW